MSEDRIAKLETKIAEMQETIDRLLLHVMDVGFAHIADANHKGLVEAAHRALDKLDPAAGRMSPARYRPLLLGQREQ